MPTDDKPTTDAPPRKAPPLINVETYLGDGLYVSWDGHTVWLRAPRPGGDQMVALEPAVLTALYRWTGPIQEQRTGGAS